MKKLQKRGYIVIFVMACAIFAFFTRDSLQEKQYYTEKNNNLRILEMETKEVSKEEMETVIQGVAYRLQGLEQDFNIVNREERIQNEKFDCIMMKRMAFEWEDAVIDVEGYFEVDKESGMIQDTLFAWSMPREYCEGYRQAYIMDMVTEYPVRKVNIRVRAFYPELEHMNLYYEMT